MTRGVMRKADYQLSSDRPSLLVVDANDQQFVGIALVVDPKRRNAPAPHDGTRPKARNRTVEFPVGQTFDASRDLRVELRGGGGIAFVEICDRLDDVGDRLFGVGDFQRPRAASIIARARLASTTRPWRYDSSAASIPASSSGVSAGTWSSTDSTT